MGWSRIYLNSDMVVPRSEGRGSRSLYQVVGSDLSFGRLSGFATRFKGHLSWTRNVRGLRCVESVIDSINIEGIDSLAAIDEIDCLQVDIEGGDLDLARDFICSFSVKVIVVEVLNHRQSEIDDFLLFLRDSGYSYLNDFSDLIAWKA